MRLPGGVCAGRLRKASEEEVVTNTDAEDAAEEAAADAEDTEEAADAAEDTAEAASDMEYVLEKGTLLVGITNFEPMDYMDENGEWIALTRIWRTLSRRA